MKIAIFTDNFLPGTGGTESVVLRLGTELAKNHQVMVFAPDYHRFFDQSKLPFKVVRAKSIPVTENDFWAMPKISSNVKKQLDDFKPDIVHSHTMGMMADFANQYAKQNNIPSVLTAHTNYKACYERALKSPLMVNAVLRRIIKRAKNADRVTAVSTFMANQLKEYGLGEKQVTIVKNGHNKMRETPFNKVTDGKFNLLYLGLVIKYKNIKFSLDALRELKNYTDDFTYHIIGDGRDKKYFMRYVKKIGLSENVIFHGRITDRDILFSHFERADAVLFTSVVDTDGLVLLEGAEAGVPSIVIENTGASERIKDGENGFVVEYDKTALANKIYSLIRDRETVKKVGEKAKEIFTSWGEIATGYQEIYLEEIAKKQV